MSRINVDEINEVTPSAGTKVVGKFAANNSTPQAAATVQAAPGANVTTTAATQTTPWGYATQAQADDLVGRVNELNVLLKEVRTLLIAAGFAV